MGIIKYSRYYSSKWLQRPNSVPTRSTRLCPDAVADSFPRMVGLTTSSLQRLAASTTRRSSLSSLPGPWHGEPTTRRLKLTNLRRRNLARPLASKRLSLVCPSRRSAARKPKEASRTRDPVVKLLTRPSRTLRAARLERDEYKSQFVCANVNRRLESWARIRHNT